MFKANDKNFYENLCRKELSDEEVLEARSNFVGFFDLLFNINERLNEKNYEQSNGGANSADKA